MKDIEKLQEEGCNFFVAAVDSDRIVLHICGYLEYPSDDDITALIEELATDKELLMIGKNFLEDYMLLDVKKDELIEQDNKENKDVK